MSQFLPGIGGARSSFPARNLTTSGLSMATVVVEASATSGAPGRFSGRQSAQKPDSEHSVGASGVGVSRSRA